jgi:carbamoyl-phosphate synthase large subunit
MSAARPLTVLATSVGNDGFPSVLEALRANGERAVRVVGVDVRESAAGLHLADAAALVPPRSRPDELVAALRRLAGAHGADVLLPLSTEDQPFFAEHADRFDGLPVVVSDPAALAVANDKLELLLACEPAGVPCPRHRSVHDVAGLASAAAELDYPRRPFVFKLNRGTGANGVKIVDPRLRPADRFLDRDNLRITYDDLVTGLADFDELPPAHLAEYLPGAEYSVDVLCDRGRPLRAVVRERLSVLYGLATHAIVVADTAAETAAAKVVELLGLHHVVNVQLRCDAAGTPRLLEVNPRIPGTIGLTVAAGVNMPYLAVKQALGEPLGDLPEPKIGTELVRTWRTVVPRRIGPA